MQSTRTMTEKDGAGIDRAAQAQSRRIALIDFARGVALLAMTVYHFSWDLAVFGLIPPTTIAEPGMIWFARSIAGSFLFLVGFSLYLAHGDGIDWSSFAKRLAVISGAAALITLATWFATPDAFIFFGILHSIAVGSVLGLAFLRAPWWSIALAGAFFLLARDLLQNSFFDSPAWWWTGLSTVIPRSNDFVPLFPFFGMVLLGMAASKLFVERDWISAMRNFQGYDLPSRTLRFLGRHSLIYYLVHQPVLIGILAGFLMLTGNI